MAGLQRAMATPYAAKKPGVKYGPPRPGHVPYEDEPGWDSRPKRDPRYGEVHDGPSTTHAPGDTRSYSPHKGQQARGVKAPRRRAPRRVPPRAPDQWH